MIHRTLKRAFVGLLLAGVGLEGVSTSFAQVKSLPFFGSLTAKCPDLFGAPGAPEDRIAELYTRLLHEYRTAVGNDDLYRKHLEKALQRGEVYSFSSSNSGEAAIGERLRKLQSIEHTGKLPSGESVSGVKIRERISKLLHEEENEIRIAQRLVTKTAQATEQIANPVQILSGIPGEAKSAHLSRDGSLALVTTKGEMLVLGDLKTGKVMNSLSGVTDHYASPDFRRVIVSVSRGGDSNLVLWDPLAGKILLDMPAQDHGIEVAPDFSRALFRMKQRDDIYFVELNLDTGAIIQKSKMEEWPAKSDPSFSFAGCTQNGKLARWDLQTGKITRIPEADSFRTVLQDVSPDLKYLVAVFEGQSNVPVLFDLKNGRKVRSLEPAAEKLTEKRYPIFSADGKRLYADIGNGIAEDFAVWDLETGKILSQWNVDPNGRRRVMQVSHDLRRALVWRDSWNLELLDLENRKVLYRFSMGGEQYPDISVNEDFTRGAHISTNGRPSRILNLVTGEMQEIDRWEVGPMRQSIKLNRVPMWGFDEKAFTVKGRSTKGDWYTLDLLKGTGTELLEGMSTRFSTVSESVGKIIAISEGGDVWVIDRTMRARMDAQ